MATVKFCDACDAKCEEYQLRTLLYTEEAPLFVDESKEAIVEFHGATVATELELCLECRGKLGKLILQFIKQKGNI